jgi:hypothetical protein
MRSFSAYGSTWAGGEKMPEMRARQWNILAVPAAVLVVMAILQIISFGRFKDWLDSINVGAPAVVAALLIIAELWGAISLLRIPMTAMLRFVGMVLVILAVGFWFIENLYLATSSAGQLPTSGFFGRYLNQQPGWWTIIEISILLFFVIYAAELFRGPSER